MYNNYTKEKNNWPGNVARNQITGRTKLDKKLLDMVKDPSKTADHMAEILPKIDDKDVRDLKSEDFRTALHIAVLKRRSDMVEVLLKHGLNPNAEDAAKRLPIDYILGYCRNIKGKYETEECLKIINYLRKAGSKKPNLDEFWVIKDIDSPEIKPVWEELKNYPVPRAAKEEKKAEQQVPVSNSSASLFSASAPAASSSSAVPNSNQAPKPSK